MNTNALKNPTTMPHLPKIIFVIVALLTLHPFVSGGMALFLGLAFALISGNPLLTSTRKLTPKLLQISVVGLGAAMNLAIVFSTGMRGLVYTTVSISLTMAVGYVLGRTLKIGTTTSLLISAGTAICGGSAIAALAPAIHAKENETSVSLATVFCLNAAALFIFPLIGHFANFSETQFGLWAALAIHDTSSVVGASIQYGPRALEVATTVKLARALWIVPLTLIISFFYFRNTKNVTDQNIKAKKPWFILGFILMSALMTWVEPLRFFAHPIAEISKRTLVLTLFLIGSALTKTALKAVGVRPLIQGLTLWLIVATASFFAISVGLINI
jgi:uncharacterized integral membrane protein (TIGR00698 family)